MKRYLFIPAFLVLCIGQVCGQINFIFVPEVYGRTVDGLGNFQMQNLTGQPKRGRSQFPCMRTSARHRS